MMTINEDRLKSLQRRRADLLVARKESELRDQIGGRVAQAVSDALGLQVEISQFDKNAIVPVVLDWPADIRLASGLVRAYVNKAEAEDTLVLLEQAVGEVDGWMEIHDKEFLGKVRLSRVPLSRLLPVAEVLEEPVVFYCDQPQGVVLVDYYDPLSDQPYSIVVQGDELLATLGTSGNLTRQGG